MPILEKTIEDDAVLYALSLNYMHFKLNALGSKGKPDQFFVAPAGSAFFVEFKRPRELPRALQWYWARHLFVRKQAVYICDNLPHAKHILNHHLDPSALPTTGAVAYDEAGKRWTILGSGAWEDFNLPHGLQAAPKPRLGEKGPGDSPA
jgi:hypothetical protein